MNAVRLFVAAALVAATTASAQDARPHVGLITDTMCGAN